MDAASPAFFNSTHGCMSKHFYKALSGSSCSDQLGDTHVSVLVKALASPWERP